MHQLRSNRSPSLPSPARSRRRFGGFASAISLSLATLLLAGGCNKDGASGSGTSANPGSKVTGTIGFVDLDRVSSQINWKTEFDNDLKTAQVEASRQFKVFQDTVAAAWEAKKKEIATSAHLNADQTKILSSMNGPEIQKLPLTQAQKDEFGQSYRQATEALNQANQLATQTLNQREGKILESFREAMKPSVRRVAMAANISMVIAPPPQANPVFYYDPSVDLTDQVVDDMRKAMPQHTLPEMPKLNFPNEFKFSPLPTTTASPLSPSSTTAPSTPR